MNTRSDMHEVFKCECHSNEHMAVVGLYDWGDDPPDFYLQITADATLTWYRRIWPAIKYIFGQPSLAWHDVLLKPADVYKLETVINAYKAKLPHD